MSDLPANSVEAVVLAELWCKEAHPQLHPLVRSESAVDPRLRVAACMICQLTAAAVAAAMQERRDGVGEGWVPVEKLVRLADEAKARRDAYPAHPHWEAWHLYEQDIRDIIGSARTPIL